MKIFSQFTESEQKKIIQINLATLLVNHTSWRPKSIPSLSLYTENVLFISNDHKEWRVEVNNSALDPVLFYTEWAKREKDKSKKEMLLSFKNWEKHARIHWSLKNYAKIEKLDGDNRFIYNRSDLIFPYYSSRHFVSDFEKRTASCMEYCEKNNLEKEFNQLKLLSMFDTKKELFLSVDNIARKILEKENEQLSFFTDYFAEKINLALSELKDVSNNPGILSIIHHTLMEDTVTEFDSSSLRLIDHPF